MCIETCTEDTDKDGCEVSKIYIITNKSRAAFRNLYAASMNYAVKVCESLCGTRKTCALPTNMEICCEEHRFFAVGGTNNKNPLGFAAVHLYNMSFLDGLFATQKCINL